MRKILKLQLGFILVFVIINIIKNLVSSYIKRNHVLKTEKLITRFCIYTGL